MKYILKNGLIVDPKTKTHEKRNLLIAEGKVYRTAHENLSDHIVIDCTDKIISPGFIDLHTHLRDPGFEYKEDIVSGTKSALAGGFTTILSMPNTIPVTDNVATIRYIVEKARDEGYVRIHPVGALSIGSQGTELVDFLALRKEGAIAFSDDGRWLADSRLMIDALTKSKEQRFRVIQHCEDPGVSWKGVINSGSASQRLGLKGIPTAAEHLAVYRDIILCEMTGGNIHIAHISTAESVRIIENAKNRGVQVTCEVTPHHLVLCDEDIKEDNAVYKVNPPLASSGDREALVDALKRGVIDTIATDHAPHAQYEKETGFAKAPFGLIGMETAFPVLYTKLVETNIIPLDLLIEKMTAAPADIFDIPARGSLSDGCDADIAIIDLKQTYRIDRENFYSKSQNTPFHDWEVRGRITTVFVGGVLRFHNNTLFEDKVGLL
ncbi:MAG: dihydroorotase [Candidatus Auribacterota bacterium]|jgi:dihydroorotase|nr:dihydroorotase [Candidatus Auribacterota bacterium]